MQKNNISIPIVVLNKINGSYYQCSNPETSCYKVQSGSSEYVKPLFNYMYCYYKQILLFILAILIIIFVEYIYMINTKTYGVINFIPGIPGSATTNAAQPQKKKNKANIR